MLCCGMLCRGMLCRGMLSDAVSYCAAVLRWTVLLEHMTKYAVGFARAPACSAELPSTHV